MKMTTANDIREWLNNVDEGATHMVVVCDSFDYEDYPKYTTDPRGVVRNCTYQNMQRAMEVYDLRKDIEEQIAQSRAWNF